MTFTSHLRFSTDLQLTETTIFISPSAKLSILLLFLMKKNPCRNLLDTNRTTINPCENPRGMVINHEKFYSLLVVVNDQTNSIVLRIFSFSQRYKLQS